MYILRATLDPESDLIRGFSGFYNSWVDTFDQIAAAVEAVELDNGDVPGSLALTLPAPQQCPVTGWWCWSPENGLSGFAFEDEPGFGRAMSRIRSYANHLGQVALFESLDVSICAGSDGEDLFKQGIFRGWLDLNAGYENVQALKNIEAPADAVVGSVSV